MISDLDQRYALSDEKAYVDDFHGPSAEGEHTYDSPLPPSDAEGAQVARKLKPSG